MLDRFTYEVYIPSIGDSARFYEIDNSHYISIQKYIQNDDDSGLQEYLKHLINILSLTSLPVINRIDMFCILSDMRVYSIGDDLNISTTLDGIKAKGTLSIDSMKNIIANYTRCLESKRYTIAPDIEMDLEIPHDLYYNHTEKFIYDCIQTITINSIAHNVRSYTQHQKSNIVDHLPSHTYNIICEYISDILSSVPVFSVTNKDTVPIDINITDNTMYELIKLIYTDDLKSLYDVMYTLNDHITIESYKAMTPGETNIFLANYLREQEQLRKQQETESHNIPSISSNIQGV